MENVPGLIERWRLAWQLAVSAGELTLRHFQDAALAVENKADGSPVTAADREAERHLRAGIAAAFPDDAIVGEEYGEQPGTSEWCWVLDPIDGTKSFLAGVPLYGTMVGVLRGARAEIGAVFFPGLGEGMHAATGQGSWYCKGLNAPVPARISSRGVESKRLLLTTCDLQLARRIGLKSWQALASSFAVTRTWGDVYGYLLVATGRADAMIDPVMNVWDAAAVQPIIEEAGGRFTDWQGRPRHDGGDSLATNGLLHDEVLAGLNAGLHPETKRA
jgi:histidinol phosphatase-like enzyme (inositol monophosphatase family)